MDLHIIHFSYHGTYWSFKVHMNLNWTALRFLLFQFFSSFQLSLFHSVLVFLSKVSYLFHNRLFLDFYFFTFLVPFETSLVFFSFMR